MASKSTARGLGTGLGALFGEAAIEGSGDFAYISIAKIEPNKAQPRVNFNKASLDELTDSIREHGVLQPLTVRSLGEGYYQIIAGERRWRAARQAGLTELPARIVEADDKKTAEISLVENLQREDLNPVEEARGFKALVSDFGMTQEEAASSVGKSRPVVANALRLLSLPEDVLQFVESGELSSGAARALLSLKDVDLIRDASRKVMAGGLNVREIERLVKRYERDSEIADRDADDDNDTELKIDYYKVIERELSDILERGVKITHSKNKGRMEIEYYDKDDFERLYAQISSIGLGKKESAAQA
jgi:ParB family chromosome partitioning protein